ncbi:MAG: LLM class flavin-dependent oxidoreductase [Pseudomonadota bacterium]
MSQTIQFDLALPQVYVDEPLEPTTIATYARSAEALGFGGLWTQDQVVGRAFTLEPLSLLSYVAAVTERIRLGASVIVLPHRDSVSLGKTIASIDQLSGGRLDIGLGLGNPNEQEAAFGLGARGERLRRFRDGVRVMKALWADGVASIETIQLTLNETPMEPKPAQRPHPKLWFGGRHPNALRRASQHADGWMGAGSSTIDEFVDQSRQMRVQLEQTGRAPSTFRIGKRLYLAVDDDERRAEIRLRAWFERYYRNADLASRVCVWGPLSKVQDAVGQLQEAHAELVLLNPLFDYPYHQETLARALNLPGLGVCNANH